MIWRAERTLPLFGGDAARAAKVYKVAFMVLSTGILVGLTPRGARLIADFLRKQIAATADRDGMVGRWESLG